MRVYHLPQEAWFPSWHTSGRWVCAELGELSRRTLLPVLSALRICPFFTNRGSRGPDASARAASKGTPRNGSWKPGARSPYTEQPAAGRERKAVPAPASEAARRGQGGTQPWRRAWPYICCWVGVGRAQPSQQGLVNDLLRRASWWPERLLLLHAAQKPRPKPCNPSHYVFSVH